jgi:hypothetical protein
VRLSPAVPVTTVMETMGKYLWPLVIGYRSKRLLGMLGPCGRLALAGCVGSTWDGTSCCCCCCCCCLVVLKLGERLPDITSLGLHPSQVERKDLTGWLTLRLQECIVCPRYWPLLWLLDTEGAAAPHWGPKPTGRMPWWGIAVAAAAPE